MSDQPDQKESTPTEREAPTLAGIMAKLDRIEKLVTEIRDAVVMTGRQLGH